jgi:hypothetical protein
MPGPHIWKIMSDEDSEEEGPFADYEIFHDGLGITHFLPPKRCRNCDG